MDNISTTWIYNEKKGKKYNKNNLFIFSENETVAINSKSDMLIDKDFFFKKIININSFSDLDKLFDSNKILSYDFQKYIFKNYLILKKDNLKSELGDISNIIYKNFNIKNDEISTIYKNINKKDIINKINKTYLK
jgi:hypothetical protein